METCPRCQRQDTVQNVAATQALTEKFRVPADQEWKALGKFWRDNPERCAMYQEYLRSHPAPAQERYIPLRTGLRYTGLILSMIGGALLLGEAFSSKGFAFSLSGCLLSLAFPLCGLLSFIVYLKANPLKYRLWADGQLSFLITLASNLSEKVDERYDELCYCSEDDVVFLPESDFCQDASRMDRIDGWIELGKAVM